MGEKEASCRGSPSPSPLAGRRLRPPPLPVVSMPPLRGRRPSLPLFSSPHTSTAPPPAFGLLDVVAASSGVLQLPPSAATAPTRHSRQAPLPVRVTVPSRHRRRLQHPPAPLATATSTIGRPTASMICAVTMSRPTGRFQIHVASDSMSSLSDPGSSAGSHTSTRQGHDDSISTAISSLTHLRVPPPPGARDPPRASGTKDGGNLIAGYRYS
ncbi:proline-rich receptor-like protein kinase PERK9 [Zingiber officinale]|uniref:proline-rich receptor-like protein kinase PERK9 n=1 Tax=Zingiber officinale TaxID=94328 RepID=UPI001C4AF3EF|nr:proline-rich receptor-like protein kinase PERK9 [Zingiber officinale]